MTFYESVYKRTVIGTYQITDGQPVIGYIEFIPAILGIDRTEEEKAIFSMDTVTAHFDLNGKFRATLLCSDDPQLEPIGSHSYQVVEHFEGGRTYYIVLLYEDGSDIDIVDLGPHSPPVPLPPQEGITQGQADARYVNVLGDVMQGPLEVLDPQTDPQAVNKRYTDTADAQIITDRDAADAAIRSEMTTADTAIRSEFAAADAQIIADRDAADAAIRSEFAAADAAHAAAADPHPQYTDVSVGTVPPTDASKLWVDTTPAEP